MLHRFIILALLRLFLLTSSGDISTLLSSVFHLAHLLLVVFVQI